MVIGEDDKKRIMKSLGMKLYAAGSTVVRDVDEKVIGYIFVKTIWTASLYYRGLKDIVTVRYIVQSNADHFVNDSYYQGLYAIPYYSHSNIIPYLPPPPEPALLAPVRLNDWDDVVEKALQTINLSNPDGSGHPYFGRMIHLNYQNLLTTCEFKNLSGENTHPTLKNLWDALCTTRDQIIQTYDQESQQIIREWREQPRRIY
jgi:hypothetical protein